MSNFINTTTLLHPKPTTTTPQPHRHQPRPLSATRTSFPGDQNQSHRRNFLTKFLTASIALGLNSAPIALAESWGTRSFLREKFLEPGLSPEDAVLRIRQTAEGLHSIRDMLEAMSWRYILFYIRLKQSYLSQDMKNALSMVPETRQQAYVDAANELVDNMAEFDYYIRTPKVYESYLYYEKTLKSIDALVEFLPA
ncbi:photosynthetic NDH subunit of lumenal location 2, chloroplastic [Rhododendron vialii]|uniref:photosynthetic NDH subunit of lumenal location 2, chloroplastic n=1 Tax=Rhododendron vialii TaxID=182163 RepID=UPI00265FFA1B|nr:photosynthetic NDH subunit of lumenal location 2, chloroplastic [Rhododendron vialii]